MERPARWAMWRSSRSQCLADDLVALLDHLEIERAVVGGISLGSAVAVNMALRYPERVRGLVLSRPAWIDRPLPENVRLYSMIAELASERWCQGRARAVSPDG